MENQEINVKMVCLDQYKNLPKMRKIMVRNKFLKNSGISYPGFYTKLRNNTFSILEIRELSKIMQGND